MNLEEFVKVKSEVKEEICEEPLCDNELNAEITSNKFSKREIKEEHFDESQLILHEEIDIKDEPEVDMFSSACGDNTTSKTERKFSCDACCYETRWKKCFIKHTLSHNKESAPKYSCNQCPYQTIYSKHFKHHLKEHSLCGLICFLCQKRFSHKILLDGHCLSNHPNESDRWRDIITYKINECPKCDYKTVRKDRLKRHLAAHETSILKSKCSVCGFRCNENNLKTHLRLHSGQLPFACAKCDKGFNRKMLLYGHIVAQHSDTEQLMNSVSCKVYQCNQCNFKTVRKNRLKKHVASCKSNQISV